MIRNFDNLRRKIIRVNPLTMMIGLTAVIFFVLSSLRHELFQSNALDLGWFDQAVYLISIGKEPIVSFVNFHILGDHAAFIFYPLALLYKIVPDVHWLFGIQAIALAVGALPTYYLAINSGLKESQALTIAVVYLLYPLVFNINLFDFHPEVIAIPSLIWAILAARKNNVWCYSLAIILILSCKAVLSLTVAAMGLWLLFFEKKRVYGSITFAIGISWFLITSQIIIPFYSGKEAAAVTRYNFLGDTVGEIIINLILQPQLVVSKIFTLPNLEYIILLICPVIWGLNPRYLTPLVAAIPALSLNLITDYQPQKNLIHQYSLPILPFLILVVISSLSAGKTWFKNRQAILIWMIVVFLALAKFGYFGSRYLESLDTWQATRQAIVMINSSESVLTTAEIAPHLTHREVIKLTLENMDLSNLEQFKFILLNLRHPGWGSSTKFAQTLNQRLETSTSFQLLYQSDDVFLYQKIQT